MVTTIVDLRPDFGPVRDQGPRPTCLAFATSDTHAALRPGWVPLSCEYAFYKAQIRAGRAPSQGAVLQPMRDGIKHDGQPDEQTWSYLPATPEASAWWPPASIDPLYARNGSAHHENVDWLIKLLDQGTPVIVLMMLSHSFFVPPPSGLIDEAPGEIPEPTQSHADIAVGHGEAGTERANLGRNSWGPGWANGGYAWVMERYLAPRMFAAALLAEEISVFSSSTTA